MPSQFDRISGNTLTFFYFLKARQTHSWVQYPEVPPPLNALAMPYVLIVLPIYKLATCVKGMVSQLVSQSPSETAAYPSIGHIIAEESQSVPRPGANSVFTASDCVRTLNARYPWEMVISGSLPSLWPSCALVDQHIKALAHQLVGLLITCASSTTLGRPSMMLRSWWGSPSHLGGRRTSRPRRWASRSISFRNVLTFCWRSWRRNRQGQPVSDGRLRHHTYLMQLKVDSSPLKQVHVGKDLLGWLKRHEGKWPYQGETLFSVPQLRLSQQEEFGKHTWFQERWRRLFIPSSELFLARAWPRDPWTTRKLRDPWTTRKARDPWTTRKPFMTWPHETLLGLASNYTPDLIARSMSSGALGLVFC